MQIAGKVTRFIVSELHPARLPNEEITALDNMSWLLRCVSHSSRLLTMSLNLLTLHARVKLRGKYQNDNWVLVKKQYVPSTIRECDGIRVLATLHQNGFLSHVA